VGTSRRGDGPERRQGSAQSLSPPPSSKEAALCGEGQEVAGGHELKGGEEEEEEERKGHDGEGKGMQLFFPSFAHVD